MPMYSIKQYLIINSDLNMGVGKCCTSAAHASMKVFFDKMLYDTSVGNLSTYVCSLSEDEREWKEGAFAKITLSSNEATMKELIQLAAQNNVAYSEVYDNGVTEVDAGSLTAIAVGPFNTEPGHHKRLVGELKKLKLLK